MTMRCLDVSRELMVPTGAVDPAALSEHLASCSSCSALSDRLRTLEQAWAATSPPEPSSSSWQSLWSGVSALSRRPSLARDTSITNPTRRPHIALVWTVAAMAQAAALLLAAWLFLPRSQNPALPHSPNLASTPVEYELEEGQTLFLRIDNHDRSIVVRPRFVETADLVAFDGDTPDPFAAAFQADLVVLNLMEGMEWPH